MSTLWIRFSRPLYHLTRRSSVRFPYTTLPITTSLCSPAGTSTSRITQRPQTSTPITISPSHPLVAAQHHHERDEMPPSGKHPSSRKLRSESPASTSSTDSRKTRSRRSPTQVVVKREPTPTPPPPLTLYQRRRNRPGKDAAIPLSIPPLRLYLTEGPGEAGVRIVRKEFPSRRTRIRVIPPKPPKDRASLKIRIKVPPHFVMPSPIESPPVHEIKVESPEGSPLGLFPLVTGTYDWPSSE